MPSASNIVHLPGVPALSWDDCRLLVETVVDYAIFMLDPDGRVATWNFGAEKIKGYKADEIIGQHFSKFFPPEDIASGKPERELRLAADLGRFEDESWRLRKNGSRFWANVIITALRDETGKLRGFGKVTRDLTVRRAAEERLRQAEERFHKLVDAVTDYAIYMLDAEGHVATWNSGASRTKGYEADEIIGKHFSLFYTDEDRNAGRPQTILDTVRREGRFEEENWRVRKDGSRFWADVVLTALYDANGAVTGFAKVTRDLTVRRESEEKDRKLLREQTAREIAEREEVKLRESEARYRDLSKRLEVVLEGVTDGISVQDPSGRVVFANTAAARICGFVSGAELISTPPAEIVARFEMLDANGEPVEVAALPGRRVLAGENTAAALVHVRERATQRDWWVEIRASAVFGEDGRPSLAINVWHDVTAEHRQGMDAQYLAKATAALGHSLAYDEMLATLASLVVPSMADWCSIHVRDGDTLREVTVSHANAQTQALVEEFRRRFPPDPKHARGVWGVLRSGVAEVFNDITEETLMQRTNDPEALHLLRRIGMTSAVLVPIQVQEGVIGVMALVYARPGRRYDRAAVALVEELGRRAGVALENAQLYRAAQEAARVAEEAARRAEQAVKAAEHASRAKDEFLATVSHELRTPLNAILGWSTLLKDRVRDPDATKPLEVIHRNAQAQVKIIEDILDVSRVITGKLRLDPRPADFVVIIRDAIEVLRPSAEAKKIHIEFKPSTDFCLIVGDPERLQQVVWNLLSNAVKFTPPRGGVEVSLGYEGSSVALMVNDTGQGIEPDFLPFVFDRFKQADSSITRRVGGLGLGLALVRHIVELHGGHVEAMSEGIGKGASFRVVLPVRAVAPADVTAPPIQKEASSESVLERAVLTGVRVLVVDDEPDARDLIAAVLAGVGAEVQTARSASEGFDAFQRFRPDVLVSDIGMPDEDGFSFMRRIRALPRTEGGAVPALALTAFAREEDRSKALRVGYTAHVGKPVDPELLASAVANLSERRFRA
jgi:PAS domain S-box-containing protein